MKNIESKLKSYFSASLKHENKVERAKVLAGIEHKETIPWYKRKTIVFPAIGGLAGVVAVGAVVGVVAGNSSRRINQPNYQIGDTIVRMDLNPSISVSVNNEGNVSSVYGNNDDGKSVLKGINVVGLSWHDALNSILKEEVRCGYFVTNTKSTHNGLKVTVYNENASNENSENIESEIVSVLEDEGVQISGDDIDTSSSSQAEELIDSEFSEVSGSSWDEIQEQIDKYYNSFVSYSSEIVEEFYEFSYYYQDKVAYFETALSELTSSWDGYGAYEAILNTLKDSLNTYTETYEEKFLAETSMYMTYYKSLIEQKVETLSFRNSVEELTDEILAEIEGMDSKLENAIQTINSFRSIVLGTISTVLDSMVGAMEDFTDVIRNDPSFRSILGSSSFNSNYISNHLSAITSFNTKYQGDKSTWDSVVQSGKESLIQGVAEARR